MEIGLLKSGLSGAKIRAGGCLGWIWRQWLIGASKAEITPVVSDFVDRGLELREKSKSHDFLGLHDLFLLNCGIFSCDAQQLNLVARCVCDNEGDNGTKPADNGELLVAAWCGMLKHWILKNYDYALQQSELIWKAKSESGVKTAAKSLVKPWLERDLNAFRKAQNKDFKKRWECARKDGTVLSENENEIVTSTSEYYIENDWCWSHCGLALLLYRQGSVVETDPFWFPAHALSVVPRP